MICVCICACACMCLSLCVCVHVFVCMRQILKTFEVPQKRYCDIWLFEQHFRSKSSRDFVHQMPYIEYIPKLLNNYFELDLKVLV